MTQSAAPLAPRGCVVRVEPGVVVVLCGGGGEAGREVRATLSARMLARVARDRGELPEPGDWVQLRSWPDGPVTVEGCQRVRRTPPAPGNGTAQVLPFRRTHAR